MGRGQAVLISVTFPQAGDGQNPIARFLRFRVTIWGKVQHNRQNNKDHPCLFSQFRARFVIRCAVRWDIAYDFSDEME